MRCVGKKGFNNNSFKHGGLNPLKVHRILKFKSLIQFKYSIENQWNQKGVSIQKKIIN
jgi:hypothetical protein